MNIVSLADAVNLGVKGSVRVQHALGWSGAAGRKDNRRVVESFDPRKWGVGGAATQLKGVDRCAAPEPATTKGDIPFRVWKLPTQ